MTFKKQPPLDEEGSAATLARQWKLSLHTDCWICNKWNFALVFFNASKPLEHMEMVFEQGLNKELNSKVFVPIKNKPGHKEKKVPMLSGGLSQWKPLNMIPLRSFCPEIDHIQADFKKKKLESVSPDPLMRK